jgi:hypothetical protein
MCPFVPVWIMTNLTSCDLPSKTRLVVNMVTIASNDSGPEMLFILDTFKAVFSRSFVFLITLGFLVMLTRLSVRLATANHWGALTDGQFGVVVVSSAFLGFAHSFLSLAYSLEEMVDFATAPSHYWAMCWSATILLGVCGGVGLGVLVLIGVFRAI